VSGLQDAAASSWHFISAKILRKPEKTNSIMESEAGSTHAAATVIYEVLKGVLLMIQDFSNIAMCRIIR